jgi:hypothetical protein
VGVRKGNREIEKLRIEKLEIQFLRTVILSNAKDPSGFEQALGFFVSLRMTAADVTLGW